jgi:hypothetical protein
MDKREKEQDARRMDRNVVLHNGTSPVIARDGGLESALIGATRVGILWLGR